MKVLTLTEDHRQELARIREEGQFLQQRLAEAEAEVVRYRQAIEEHAQHLESKRLAYCRQYHLTPLATFDDSYTFIVGNQDPSIIHDKDVPF